MRFEAACDRTRTVVQAARRVIGTEGAERSEDLARLATTVQKLIDDAASAPEPKSDRKSNSTCSEAVIAASKVLIAAVNAEPAVVATPGSTVPPFEGVTLEDFEFLQPIAEGGAGKVYLARLIRTGQAFAVKLMDKASLRTKNMLSRVLKERRIMAKASALEKARVVKLHYAFRTRSHLCLVMVCLVRIELPCSECSNSLCPFSAQHAGLCARW
jgi:hypothetical protein